MTHKAIALCLALVLLPALLEGALFPPVEGDLCATIPFEFIVGGKTLPAGNYVMRVGGEGGIVEICEDGVYCQTIASSPVEVASAPAGPELAFRKYGNQYFLSQIWPGGRVGRHLPQSSVEPAVNQSIRTWEAAYVAARPTCIHENAGMGLASTWH